MTSTINQCFSKLSGDEDELTFDPDDVITNIEMVSKSNIEPAYEDYGILAHLRQTRGCHIFCFMLLFFCHMKVFGLENCKLMVQQ